jgi:hypothetical protein
MPKRKLDADASHTALLAELSKSAADIGSTLDALGVAATSPNRDPAVRRAREWSAPTAYAAIGVALRDSMRISASAYDRGQRPWASYWALHAVLEWFKWHKSPATNLQRLAAESVFQSAALWMQIEELRDSLHREEAGLKLPGLAAKLARADLDFGWPCRQEWDTLDGSCPWLTLAVILPIFLQDLCGGLVPLEILLPVCLERLVAHEIVAAMLHRNANLPAHAIDRAPLWEHYWGDEKADGSWDECYDTNIVYPLLVEHLAAGVSASTGLSALSTAPCSTSTVFELLEQAVSVAGRRDSTATVAMCCFVTDVLTKRLIGEKADRCDECGAETIGRALAWLARALREPAAAPYAAQHIASVEAFFASRGEKPLLCTSRRKQQAVARPAHSQRTCEIGCVSTWTCVV